MSMSEGGRPLVDARFELVSRLGSGGMGTVWRARDIALDREVALKEVRPPDPAVEEAGPGRAARLRERAVREARALARLSNPHVVTIHHIVEPADGSHPWIVMELVEGCSVHERLARGPMSVPEVAALGLQVLSALRAAHAAGIHHRDVKPANVLLRPDGSAVLTDFGIAALSEATSRLTSTGDLIGSPEFIAPERVRGEEGNPASDLWSLGMLLYVAAEGHHPFRRATSLATVVAVLDDPIPPPVRSGALGPVLDRLLVRDPARRPDGAELERLLRGAAAREAGTAPATEARTEARPDARPDDRPEARPDARPDDRPAATGPRDAVPFAPPGHPMAPGHATAPDPVATPGHAAPRYGQHPAYGGPPAHHAAWVPPTTARSGGFGPPVPPGRRPAGRRAVAVTVAAVATVAIVVVAALNWPTGGSAGDQGKGRGTPSSGSAPRTPASGGTGDTPPGTGTAPSAGSAGAATRGTLLTAANIRTVLGAFREASGSPQVKEVTFYEDYAKADIPTGPGAKTYDEYQYRDGVATRTGPGGGIDPDYPGEQPFDAAAVAWDTLPALIKRGENELEVADPDLRYVIVGRWTFNADRPTVRFHLSNEYMQSGYLAADTRGKVVASHPAS
ncbi:protein kinase domain-containing protein [Streptomyces lavendofoliae]|uniref:protein kinase domain-containing protein n=1 Tax=Streptomyces lavendofoliae TaxID=67314 RepID=UPI00300ED786